MRIHIDRSRVEMWLARAVVACVPLLLASLVCWAQQSPDQPTTTIPAGAYRIAGNVVNGKTGGTLAGVRVTVSDTKNRQSAKSVMTGDDGRFEFHVPAGKYSLEGSKRGFITTFYEQHETFWTAIVTGAEVDSESLTLRMRPNAVLGGTIFDEFQEPVRNAQITLYRENHLQGVSRIHRYHNAMTDDQGRYEFAHLEEGTYFVSVRASPWYAIHPNLGSEEDASVPAAQVDSALDAVYPMTYYGDTTETDGALPIPVRGGDHLEADIHLSPTPSLRFLVHVPEGASQGVGFVLQKTALDGTEQVETTGYEFVGPGLIEVSGVAAGRYTAKLYDPKGVGKESNDVDISGGGELDLSQGNALSTVKLAAQVEGPRPERLLIGLRNSKGRTQFSEVDVKNETEFTDILPGRYDLVATSGGGGYAVVQVATAKGVVAGHSLTVAPGATLNVAVTVAGGSVSIDGFAKRDGKGVSAAMIVLVPKDPVADHDRFRRDQSDLDGSFTLRDVIPGEYTAIAIEDGWDLDWSQPGVLAHYLSRGEKVNAAGGTVRLGVVAVQEK